MAENRTSNPLYIAWEKGPEVIAYDEAEGRDNVHKTHYFKYEEVMLVRKNRIDFQKLKDKCLGENYGPR